MVLKNQDIPLSELELLADGDCHNVLIDGSIGSGKSYLAKQYADMLGVSNFQIVESKISNVKEIMDMCIDIDSPIVVCIENLDMGVDAVSYALLKFFEEPSKNVYIVITCRNSKNVPDTILSRSAVVNLTPMSSDDITKYAQDKYSDQLNDVKESLVWKSVKSISDVDTIMKLDFSKVKYFDTILDVMNSTDPVLSIVWKLQKFPDGSSTPMDLILKCAMLKTMGENAWCIIHNCLCTVETGRVGIHAALSKMVMEYKYMVKKGN